MFAVRTEDTYEVSNNTWHHTLQKNSTSQSHRWVWRCYKKACVHYKAREGTLQLLSGDPQWWRTHKLLTPETLFSFSKSSYFWKKKWGPLALPVHENTAISIYTNGYEIPPRRTLGSFIFLAGISTNVPTDAWVWTVVTSSRWPWISASQGFMAKCPSAEEAEVLRTKRITRHESFQQEKGNWKGASLWEDVEARKPLISTSLGDWKWKDLEAGGKSSSVTEFFFFFF